MRVVAAVRLVFHVGNRNRDTPFPLFGSLVDHPEFHQFGFALLRLHTGDRAGKRRLAVVHVTNRANVHMRFCALKFFLRHDGYLLHTAPLERSWLCHARAIENSLTAQHQALMPNPIYPDNAAPLEPKTIAHFFHNLIRHRRRYGVVVREFHCKSRPALRS